MSYVMFLALMSDAYCQVRSCFDESLTLSCTVLFLEQGVNSTKWYQLVYQIAVGSVWFLSFQVYRH